MMMGTRLWYGLYGDALSSDGLFEERMVGVMRELGDRGRGRNIADVAVAGTTLADGVEHAELRSELAQEPHFRQFVDTPLFEDESSGSRNSAAATVDTALAVLSVGRLSQAPSPTPDCSISKNGKAGALSALSALGTTARPATFSPSSSSTTSLQFSSSQMRPLNCISSKEQLSF